MKCEKCAFVEDNAYCPNCGAKSVEFKKGPKRRIFIRADKTLITGMVFIIVGILALGALLIVHLTILVGLALAITAFGLAVLIRGKQCIKVNSASDKACKFCCKEIERPWSFCCRCGSRIK